MRTLALNLPKLTGKPCFFYSSFARTNNRALGEELAEHGVPCLNGAGEMLLAVKKVQEWADRRREPCRLPARALVEDKAAEAWRAALQSGMALDERTALDLIWTITRVPRRCRRSS